MPVAISNERYTGDSHACESRLGMTTWFCLLEGLFMCLHPILSFDIIIL